AGVEQSEPEQSPERADRGMAPLEVGRDARAEDVLGELEDHERERVDGETGRAPDGELAEPRLADRDDACRDDTREQHPDPAGRMRARLPEAARRREGREGADQPGREEQDRAKLEAALRRRGRQRGEQRGGGGPGDEDPAEGVDRSGRAAWWARGR